MKTGCSLCLFEQHVILKNSHFNVVEGWLLVMLMRM